MKKQIRRGVFETNSSMMHSLQICTEEDYHKWENGEIYFDDDIEELVPVTDDLAKEHEKSIIEDDYQQFLTKEEYYDHYGEYYETYRHKFTTPSGENMVAFGYFGHD